MEMYYFPSIQDVRHSYAQITPFATITKIRGPTPMDMVAALTTLDARTAIERTISVLLPANPEMGFSECGNLTR